MIRELREEILDGLRPEDPQAVRSRRDLQWINLLMGNERWILRQVEARAVLAKKGIVEIGAGEGHLARRLAEWGPVQGVDLVPRPKGLPAGISWHEGNVLEAELSGGILVANLFLHHFDEEQLRQLGRLAGRFGVLICVEPWRSLLALKLGACMNPLVGPVTKHDMDASIRAGFRVGELAQMMGLERWSFSEKSTWRGGLRVVAWHRV